MKAASKAKTSPAKIQKRREALRQQLRAGGAPLAGLAAELKVGTAALEKSGDVNLRRAATGAGTKAATQELPKALGKMSPEVERWKALKTGEGQSYHVDTVTGLTAWEIPVALMTCMKATAGPGSMKQSGQVVTLQDGRVVVKGPDTKSGALLPMETSLPVASGAIRGNTAGMGAVAAAFHVNGQMVLQKSGESDSPMMAILSAFLKQGYGSSGKYSFAQPAGPTKSIDCASGPPIFITMGFGAAGAGVAVARRTQALGAMPMLLGLDSYALHSAVDALFATTKMPQTLTTTDDGGSTWRPFLRPRTRAAGKSKKSEAKRIQQAQEEARKGQAQGGSLPFEDMQAFQIEAQRAAQAQAMQEAQAAAEAMSQQWVAQQAAAQAEAAAAQAAARQASTQALLSFMAQSQAKDLATMGASALDDTPLMHSGVSSMSSGTLKGVLHEPTYEMAFLYEFQYASMAESASQVEPRAATAKTDMLAAAEKEKKKEGGCIGRGVRIRGSTASGYSFYDMTQMAGGAPTGQKIARTGTVQALLP